MMLNMDATPDQLRYIANELLEEARRKSICAECKLGNHNQCAGFRGAPCSCKCD